MPFPPIRKPQLFLWIMSGGLLGVSLCLTAHLSMAKSLATLKQKHPIVVSPSTCTLPEALPQVVQSRGLKVYELKTSTTLCSAKSYTLPVVIKASNVTLDCNQATLNGATLPKKGSTQRVAGITSIGNSHVTIRNCTIANFPGNGVTLRSSNYMLSPSELSSNHLVENVKTRNNGHVGVYLQARDSIVRNAHIDGDALGIYITSNSSHITVSNTVVENTTHREGIAIDAAFDNTIQDNTIRNNARHGITLYKNCGEHASSNIRPYPARGNAILNNRITGHTRPIRLDKESAQDITPGTGIAVALRQGKTLAGQQVNPTTGAAEPCSDPKSYGLPNKRHFDFAPDTLIQNNQISGNTLGVYIADSGTRVIRNDFKTDGGNTWLDVFVGNIWLDAVQKPVQHTILDKNTWKTNKPLAQMRVATSGSRPLITGSDALMYPRAFGQSL
jgi:parallel beta-helix repeat protein